MLRQAVDIPRLSWQALRAARYGAGKHMPGMVFNRFGRQLGLQLLSNGMKAGVSYLVAPVSSFRYFEFPFVASCLPARIGRCLDVSSPSLFSFFVARQWPDSSITMINPDVEDISRTSRIVRALGMRNIVTVDGGLERIASGDIQFDCIWSISVVEHIAGERGDSEAVNVMYNALAPGGRLILTTMVDRTFWKEYRNTDYYGTQPAETPGLYFFQRYYDEAAILDRLIKPIGQAPKTARWFGEVTAGRFATYEQHWLQDGLRCTVEDPREFADHYREYSSWAEMPGRGVCGLMIEKPGADWLEIKQNGCVDE